MLRLMLLMTVLSQAPATSPQRHWLDCLDASGRPAKVYGWQATRGGQISYWPNENPHLSAKPVSPATAITPTGPVVNYGVNLPAPQAVGESTHTNDRAFAESMISEQEGVAESQPSPGGLLDRFKPKPKPCPGPGPCPSPDGEEIVEDPGPGDGRSALVVALIGVGAAVFIGTALVVVGIVAMVSRPAPSREAPLNVPS